MFVGREEVRKRGSEGRHSGIQEKEEKQNSVYYIKNSILSVFPEGTLMFLLRLVKMLIFVWLHERL